MRGPKISIVVPVFNEQENLQELIERCLKAGKSSQRSFELILIDDGSSDLSPQMIGSAAEQIPEVIGVLLNRNYGQHAAVIAGLRQSRGEMIITLDADLQNPPEEIPHLVAKMEEGFDVVGTIRNQRQDSFFRRFASAIINRIVQQSTGVIMHDYGCMLRGYRRNIVDAMLQCTERSTFIPILANSFAKKTTEIRVAHAARTQGQSKYSLFKLVSLQFDLLTSISTFPLRLLSLLGISMAAFGICFGVLLMILRFYYGAGWAADGVFSLFSLLFFFVGAQFLGMGLLGEYIGRIYSDVRGRPRYFIHEVKGLAQAAEQASNSPQST